MTLSELSIKRPVFATVLSLVLVLVGLVSYQRLSVREYPAIDPPVITVETTYPGASAAIVETQVTQVLEDSLAGIEGIDFITSISRQESSQITVTFNLDRNPDYAAADIRDRVGRVRGHLPEEIEEPIIQKREADAQPILYLAFSSTNHSALEITDYADRYVKDQLQTLNGVAEVRLFGDRAYSMRLWLDPERLAAYQLTPQDVENALRRQNVEVPSGRIESLQREFTVLAETDLRTPEQFNDLIIKDANSYLVRLRDVGMAELGPLDERRIVRFNGEPAIAVGVIKQATANPLEVSDAVNEMLPTIRNSLPEGMQVRVAHDKSIFIAESIKNVYTTIGEAIVLVILIIFLFLRSIRATLIPLVTIPVSLIGAFALMYAFGFSINTLTLLALVLAIGLVVDDAIVMLENIYRHVEEGMTPVKAALLGSREISFAIIAMTITLAAVYAPIGFMTGLTGRLFTEFAWTLAGAVIVSGFVALTLSPMMCSKLLKQQTHRNFAYRIIERFLDGVSRLYCSLLKGALAARPLVLLIGLAVAGSSYFLFANLKSELAPVEDEGRINVNFRGPEGATIEFTDEYARQIEELALAVPEADRVFVVSGSPTVSQGRVILRVKPWDERVRSQQEIGRSIAPAVSAVTGVVAYPSNAPPLGQSSRSKPINFVIQTSQPYSELQKDVDALLANIREYPGLVDVESDLKLNSPQLDVSVDREKAASMGIEIETLGRTLETMLGGRQVTRFKREGQQYDVVVKVADIDRENPDDMRRIYVRGVGGAMTPLSNLITIKETVAPKELNHFNQLRAATITGQLAPGYSLSDGLAYLQEAADKVLPPTVHIEYAGESREFREASANMYITFMLALAFIYLVLAAQFESFTDPLIIMLTVPLSVTGALLALWWSGGTLNIYSQVGLVTLIGLITKHGILIVEFSNQLRGQGQPMHEAVIEAAALRLRPILMTTGAMVLGAVPLALATGAGAEGRQDIGWVIVGGLLVGTLFTLFVVPVVYTYLSRRQFIEFDETVDAADGSGAQQQPEAAE
ncbi:efflux RND transporter permease subunit [Methyloceanibacter caenitepidi]|uniref:RND multidrug efflux transporter n=1 Tax=Methyloceanibacter caenitepidi TaxID=1384459 RepID=A0A0A8K2C5_9HYPH|nr:efflux RND transporter permease subunit [Methyloceanibacter caenitepidi]BAQ16677.1 RND multidrug efflux transporter [Methyloceanibacter caenitepidi]